MTKPIETQEQIENTPKAAAGWQGLLPDENGLQEFKRIWNTGRRFASGLFGGFLAQAGFLLLTGALLYWSFTIISDLMETLIPNAPTAKYLAIAIFDGGAVIWLLVFLYRVDGIFQSIIAGLMVFFNTAGGALAVAADLLLGGFVEYPGWIPYAAIVIVAVWTLANFIATITFHLTGFETLEKIGAQMGNQWTMAITLMQSFGKQIKSSDVVANQISDFRARRSADGLLNEHLPLQASGAAPAAQTSADNALLSAIQHLGRQIEALEPKSGQTTLALHTPAGGSSGNGRHEMEPLSGK
jgi:hypothetical protein